MSFHFNVPDRCVYACRLLRKAVRQGARVAVIGQAAVLGQLDRLLWAFDPLEFVPHVFVRAGAEVPPRLRTTPVWLVDDVSQAGHHDVLVNLNPTLPAGFESFGRLIEIVTPDEADRNAARERWKHYASRGYGIAQHDMTRDVTHDVTHDMTHEAAA